MYDNSIITKNELSSYEQELKNKFYQNEPQQSRDKVPSSYPSQYNPPNVEDKEQILPQPKIERNPILATTKNSFRELFLLKPPEKNQKLDEVEIKKILFPLYDIITDIKEEMRKLTEMTKIDYSKKENKNMSESDVNNLYNLHNKFIQDKANIEATKEYLDDPKNENFENEEIKAAITDLISLFEVTKNEMNAIEEEFNDKFDFVIREKKRQKIADELLKGTYNKANGDKIKGDINFNNRTKLDEIDYNQYKNDIVDIELEKNKVCADYKALKDSIYDGLPILVKPKDKTYFSYSIGNEESKENNPKGKSKVRIVDPDFNYHFNTSGTGAPSVFNKDPRSFQGQQQNISNKMPGQMYSGNTMMMSTSPNSNVGVSSKSYRTRGSPDKSRSLGRTRQTRGAPYVIPEDEGYNDDKKEDPNAKMTPQDKMFMYQQRMMDAGKGIETTKPKGPPPPKTILVGPSKEDIIRGIQPRSSKCKKTLQTFKKKKLPPKYRTESFEYKKKPFRFGRYPKNPEDPLKYIIKPPKPDDELDINGYKVHYPYGLPENEMKKLTEKFIELYIRDKLNKGKEGPDVDRKKVEIINEREGGGRGSNYNDELLRLLIQKFGDLEDAIRGNWGGEHGRGRGTGDINEDIANEIYRKMKNDLTININLEGYGEGGRPGGFGVPPQNAGERGREGDNNESHVSYSRLTQSRMSRSGVHDRPFESTKQIPIEELDKLIEMPHDINLKDYDISNTSSYVSVRETKEEFIKGVHQIDVDKYKDESNSLSRGQVDDNSSSLNNSIRNRTPLDLLMLKAYNENLPEQIINSNVSQIEKVEYDDDDDNGSEEDDEVNEIVDINSNERLKMLQLYESNEYNEFKKKFNGN